MKTIQLAIIALLALSASNNVMANEPSEADMKAAIQQKLNQYYDNTITLAEGCSPHARVG